MGPLADPGVQGGGRSKNAPALHGGGVLDYAAALHAGETRYPQSRHPQ